ncbi:DUF6950 family protein [Pseudovibrio exalbescens]|uniref:DUF6950 family protein n=1 Tax=Pseudovibrio exalbescens TaxID=197461 RepID=UPI000C9D1A84
MTDQLSAYLAQERLRPFEWGQRNGDCCLFAFGWTAEAWGIDPRPEHWGKYSTEDQVIAYVKTLGGLPAILKSHYGSPVNDNPRRGDIALLDTPQGLLGAICSGGAWWFRCNRTGVGFIPLRHGKPTHIWRR